MDVTGAIEQPSRKQRPFDEEQYTCGLRLARSLNFSDEQYEEALKKIERPDNANQLLVALIDVSGGGQQQQASNKSDLLQFHQDVDPICAPGECDTKSTNTPGDSGFCGAPLPVDSSCSTSSSCSSLTTSSGVSSLAAAAAPQQSSFIATPFVHGTSFGSSNQSLESLSQQPQFRRLPDQMRASLTRTLSSPTASNGGTAGDLKKIYVDGSNVARTHGRDVAFSWRGIELCVEWFRARNHHVRVLVPENKFCGDQQQQQQQSVMEQLHKLEVLVKTPNGCNDDLMIIEAARQNNGIIVSNDQYRDERRRATDPELDKFVSASRLPYVFVDDLFMPAADPQGRNGPTLDEFLRHSTTLVGRSNLAGQRQKLCKTRSHPVPRHSNVAGAHGRTHNSIYRQQHQSLYIPTAQQQQQQSTDYRPTTYSWQGPARPQEPHPEQQQQQHERHHQPQQQHQQQQYVQHSQTLRAFLRGGDPCKQTK